MRANAFDKKNISTFMCSNYENGESKWITIGVLSERNEEIFKKLMQENSEQYGYSDHYKTYMISAEGNGNEVSKRLIELTNAFEMQDVLDEGDAYKTVESYLVDRFGISKVIPNPDYKEIKEPKLEDYEDAKSHLKALSEWRMNGEEPEEIEVFDESKMTRPLEEYLEEAGVTDLYDAERGVVYTSEFYRDMHLRYLEYLREHGEVDPVLTPEQLAEDEEARKATEEFVRETQNPVTRDENIDEKKPEGEK